MSDTQHLVYVIYRDGKPVDPAGGRPAYLTESTARAQITHLSKREVSGYWQPEKAAEVTADKARYTIVPYGRVPN
ncbi:hypothetical protein [Paenibacillus pinihumi]|uniref:hypothetical protein n=1 Tax=Paenibacillus pinihumi TaxID=669462 RepID=UPI0004088E78|nr:hypothetical protein [Paenibacillus pinihumi]